jgi:endonuclease/exonuclease/phosphatase (EEP) superfamily protein YafD
MKNPMTRSIPSSQTSFTTNLRATTKSAVVVGLLGLLVIVGTMTMAGFLSQCSFYCEMASHLRLIYMPVLAACAVASLLTRRRLVATAAVVLLCVNVWAVSGLYGERPHSTMGSIAKAREQGAVFDTAAGETGSSTRGSKTDQSVKIMSINLWGGKNRKFAQAIAEIKRNDPDVIGFSEITWLWWKKLEPALVDYPYRSMELKYGGIAVFSRLPLKESHIEYFGIKKRPRVATKCKMGDNYVNLLVVHPFAPLKEFKQRNLELTELGAEVKHLNAPIVLAGDINCSPWSYYFSKLLHESGLEDSEQGFGAQPSWPAIRNHALIPIDHCLVSKDIQVVNRQIGRNIGSDHLPVIIELQTTSNKTSRQISFHP